MRKLTNLTNPGGPPIEMVVSGALVAKFGIPPFSVFNAASGPWQDIKRKWLALGIRSELGRGAVTFEDQDGLNRLKQSGPSPGGGVGRNSAWKLKTADGYRTAKDILETQSDGAQSEIAATGTSIFDPALCELFTRWFVPTGGTVLDPFAGGSVRGLVAGCLGCNYVGIDLRGEQVAANEEQSSEVAEKLAKKDEVALECCDWRPSQYKSPLWIEADSTLLDQLWTDPVDAVLTCPPYFDLEAYSEDPRDLSAMSWPQFLELYQKCLANAVGPLRPNRFAGIVIGDVRDSDGNFRGLVAQTIIIAERLGLKLYNQAVLVTAAGSLPLRAAHQFQASRKFGTGHQHVLVFVKGDGKAAAAACAPFNGSV